jgi:hypothetical protein
VDAELSIRNNDALTSLVGLENLTSVGGDLWIRDNNVLTNLCALYNVNLDGFLDIRYNTMLSMDTANALETQLRINGFSGIAQIHDNNGSGLVRCDYPGDYKIDHIDTSGDIETLYNYKGVTGNLRILYTSLTSLSALSNLTSVGGGLEIFSDDDLTSLTGLENITSVGGLSIYENIALTSISALSNITGSLSGSLIIEYNDVLTNLTGLENITSVGYLSIYENDALTSISALSNITSVDDLWIGNNYALTNLTGLENLNSVGG